MKKRNLLRKKILETALILGLVLVPMQAWAAETELVVIDPFTGEELETIVGEDTTSLSESTTSSYEVSNNCEFDPDQNLFVYNNGAISSTAFDGMITNAAVAVYNSASATITVYRDGEAVDASEYENLTEAGSYIIRTSTEKIFSFQIVEDYSNTITSLDLPDSFYITDVVKDNEHIDHEDHTLSLQSDGSYEITYNYNPTGTVYVVDIIIDRTAPALTFDGLDEENVANGPVTISGVESGSTLEITRDGKSVSASTELTESGTYYIVCTDAAGNSSNYSFRINVYFNVSAIVVIICAAAILIGLIAFFIYSRKHLRTR